MGAAVMRLAQWRLEEKALKTVKIKLLKSVRNFKPQDTMDLNREMNEIPGIEINIT